jgi:GH24 family phage-related lysozyme (muramidase)
MGYLDDSYSALKRFEGVIPHLYLDSVGNATIGVGFLVASVYAASTLPFVNPDGSNTTPDQIAYEFNRVKALPSDKPADFYRTMNSPLLPMASIDQLLASKVNSFEVSLRRLYADYDAYPGVVKEALLDMVYNLGAAKLQAQYPKFNAAVRAHDWLVAAAECHRNGPSAERNAWTSQQFMEAV